MLYTDRQQYPLDYFPRRVKWSPDGSSVVALSYDDDVSIFEFDNQYDISLWFQAKGTVTDVCWYPLMMKENQTSCAFAMIVPLYPIELVDSNDGHVRAIYRCQYGGDQPASLACLGFYGSYIIAGGTKTMFFADITRPGRISDTPYHCSGSILSLATHCDSSIIAAGTSTGSLRVIDGRSFQEAFNESYHIHGVDSIIWSNNILFSSSRLSDTIIGLDIRNPDTVYMKLSTFRSSSRKISMSATNNIICVGNEGEEAHMYDISGNLLSSIGSGPTPIIEVSCYESIVAASGSFQVIENDDIPEFKPVLKELGFYKKPN